MGEEIMASKKIQIMCDHCGREIEIGNQSGLVVFDVHYDEKNIKHLSNFRILHKNFVGHGCDDDRSTSWVDLDKAINLYYWMDLIDPKYNHGKDKEAQYTVVDLSLVEAMYRCLFPGYDEARHYALNYGREELEINREPTINEKSIKDILKWAKKRYE